MKLNQKTSEAKNSASVKLSIKKHTDASNLPAALVNTCNNSPQPLYRAGDGALLRLPQVLARFPVARSTWYAGVRSGIYPEPLLISRRVVAWTQESIDALIRRQATAGNANKF